MSPKAKLNKQTGETIATKLKRSARAVVHSFRIKQEDLNELKELGISISPLLNQAVANAIRTRVCPCCGHRVSKSLQSIATHKIEEYGIDKKDL